MHRYSKKTQVIKSHFIFRFSFLVVNTGKNITMACLGKSIIISKYLQNFNIFQSILFRPRKNETIQWNFTEEKNLFWNFWLFLKFCKNTQKIPKIFKMAQNGIEILPRLDNFRALVEKFYFSYHTVDQTTSKFCRCLIIST